MAGKAGEKLSRHYLKLQRGLVALRIACSGGHIPLKEANGNDNKLTANQPSVKSSEEATTSSEDLADTNNDNESEGKTVEIEDFSETNHNETTAKETKLSAFCFTSKMEKLIEQLIRIRDDDSSGMKTDRRGITFSFFMQQKA